MEQTNRPGRATRRRRGRRIATATFVAAGLAGSLLTAGVAGASTGSAIVISTTKNAKLGTVLVSGNTLYAVESQQDGLHHPVSDGLASGAVAQGRHVGDGRQGRQRGQARHGEAVRWHAPGDLCGQTPLLVQRRQRGGTGERERDGQVGQVVVRHDGEVRTDWSWIHPHDQPQFRRRFFLAPDSSVERSS